MAPETLRIDRFLPLTRVEGPGLRACIWVQGCSIRCPGCAVPWTWPVGDGREIAVEELAERISASSGIEGVTFLGGEPFDQALALASLGARVRRVGLSVVTFTGYTVEDLRAALRPGTADLLAVTDLLIDGPYRRDLPDMSRPWTGSANKRYHFLTDRYLYLEPMLCRIPNRVEVRILPDGRVSLNGMFERRMLDSIFDDLALLDSPALSGPRHAAFRASFRTDGGR